ncbi:hypothetical protein B7494_g2775 [Chlorociboria aeruginascens]|nr:hypothetical protein B7494_g2775 [Chlorociboria aeruginascens]
MGRFLKYLEIFKLVPEEEEEKLQGIEEWRWRKEEVYATESIETFVTQKLPKLIQTEITSCFEFSNLDMFLKSDTF